MCSTFSPSELILDFVLSVPTEPGAIGSLHSSGQIFDLGYTSMGIKEENGPGVSGGGYE